MRTAHKVWGGLAAAISALILAVDLTGCAATEPSAADNTTPSGSADALSADQAAGKKVNSVVTVTKVIDGDTFVAGGTKIQVLGIDSCELNTYGGELARSAAQTYLDGQQVTLRREPGVNRDKQGRALRYVDISSIDFGELMVGYDHTAVYEGDAASPGYLDRLREADFDGRICSDPAPAPAPSEPYEDDSSIDWPSPGDQGLPDGLLTGGFCADKSWC